MTPSPTAGSPDQPALGIDFGGVIVEMARGGSSDTSLFDDDYLEAPPTQGALEAIRALADAGFGERIWIVSKAGHKMEARTRAWLAHHRFQQATGVTPDRWIFCRERADKAPIAARLGLTHFIDDRQDVLGHLDQVAHRILFRSAQTPAADLPTWRAVTVAHGWPAVLAAVRPG